MLRFRAPFGSDASQSRAPLRFCVLAFMLPQISHDLGDLGHGRTNTQLPSNLMTGRLGAALGPAVLF